MQKFISIVDTSLSCYPIHDDEWPRLAVCGEFQLHGEWNIQHVTLEVVLRGKKGQILQLAEAFVEVSLVAGKCAFKVDCDYSLQYAKEIDSVEVRVLRCDVRLETAANRTFLSASPIDDAFDEEPFDDLDEIDDSTYSDDDLH